MIKNVTLIIILTLFMPEVMISQGMTTASVNGITKDTEGNILVGVNVKVTHDPSGTVMGGRSNKSGRFNVVGLRVGGPFTIEATMVGYSKSTLNNINLGVGQNMSIDIILSQRAVRTADVEVFASKGDIISSEKTGASQTISEEEINNLPTISRSIHDYSRLSPHVISSTSEGSNVGGRNSKYNTIQVDGAVMSDAFGLSASGTPGGQAESQPISLDAIQEFQVSVSPFDVREGGFTGGAINAITRSGSNNLRGGGYFFGRNGSFVGTSPDANRRPFDDFGESVIGARVGGPVFKNKLFYFMNGEYKSRTDPFTIALGDPSALRFFPLSADSLDIIRQISINQYNYDPGTFENYSRSTDAYKMFARLDYNISDKHRLTFRHNFVHAYQGKDITRAETFYSFSGQEYLFNSMQNQSVLQLNSVFGSRFANELRVAITSIDDSRDAQSPIRYPQITISRLGPDGSASVSFGTRNASQANELSQRIIEVTDNFNIFLGNHVITAGISNQFITFDNLFIQNFNGAWTFEGVEAYKQGIARGFTRGYSLIEGVEMPRARFSYGQLGFYVQDEWTIQSNFKILAGVRGDMFVFPDKPLANPKVMETFKNPTEFSPGGLRSDNMPNPLAFSPRLGFNWDVFDDKTNQLRGGIGIFSGRTPGVWLANQYSNTGMDLGFTDIRDPSFQFTEELGYNAPTGAIQTTEVNLIDPDFKMPQIFRANIAYDRELPYGFFATVEIIYGKTIYDAVYRNLNLKYAYDNDGNQIFGIDGRPRYMGRDRLSNDFTRVLYLTNTTEGNQSSYTIQLQKPFRQGIFTDLSLNLAYTYNIAMDVNSLTSSVAASNWQFNHIVDPNNPTLTNSLFSIPHRVLANLSYRFELAKGYNTTVGLFYEGRSGAPFSMVYFSQSSVYIGDANNDDHWSNDLVYIPTGPNDDKMILTTGNWDELEYFINQFDELTDQRGEISERYSLRQPWRNNLDIRITQDIPINRWQRFQISLDILNFMNMLDPTWGYMYFMPNSNYSMMRFEGYVSQAEINAGLYQQQDLNKIKSGFIPNFRGNNRKDIFSVSDLFSRWQMQLGVRYFF
ncbi:MAG: TonB-dependent receptor [Candidatus Kapabacteria bacterium]|nr:TonB-dependent receptor [Ignavibacteriota bacterium]MCW5886329.1 TonB-dependent receptor [Candidatus Kapabacteria bacterium]